MPRPKHFKNAAGSWPPLGLQQRQASSAYPKPEMGIPKKKEKRKKINGELFNIVLALRFKKTSPHKSINWSKHKVEKVD